MADPLLHLVVAASLALLFVTAARHKFRGGVRFAAQLDAYDLVPSAIAGPLARALPYLELLVGAALLWPATRPYAALAAAGLLGVYGLAIGINVLRGRTDIDCGCGDEPQPVSGWLVIRNSVLVALALVLLLPAPARSLGVADALALVLLTGLLATTYGMLEQLLRNQAALRSWGTDHG